MTPIVTLLSAAVVVLLPGLAAVRWGVRRIARTGGVVDLPQKVTLAYGGIGVACLALWLTATIFGVSAATSIGAPLTAAVVLVLATFWRRRAAPPEGDAVLSPSREPARGGRAHRSLAPLAALSLASVVLVAVPFAPYGWERADGVHRMAMSDWEKHLAMTTAIAASPAFPPPHPYLHSDRAPSYYFGYHLVAASLTTLGSGPGGAFAALLLLTLLTAAAAPFVVYTFARDLCSQREALLAAGASCLFVGFDVVVLAIDTARAIVAAWPLPGGFAGLRAIIPSTHIDYWIHNVDRSFSAPIVATMWSPHQVAATLVALLVLWLLAPAAGDPARARAGGLLPALLIASVAALSSYIALGLAIGIAGAAIAEAYADRKAPWRTATFRRWAVPGLVAVLLALPVYPVVMRGSSSGLVFSISTAGTWVNGAVFSWLFGARQWTNLLDTPAVYVVELGVIGVLGALQVLHLLRTRPLAPVERQTLAIAVSVILLLTFVRPPVGIGNNLYARALMLAWFALAPFAAAAAVRLARSRAIAAAACVCLLGTAYAEVGYLLQGGLFWATPKADVDALRWINDHTPPRAIVAIHPADYENNHGYWLRRPLVIGNERLAVLFGADEAHYARVASALVAAYGETDAKRARQDFEALEADVILVRVAGPDPAWMDPACFDLARPNPTWSVAVRKASCVG